MQSKQLNNLENNSMVSTQTTDKCHRCKTHVPLTEEEIDRATAQARDALLDHIYEYGTAAEGVLERIRKLCRAVERAHGIGGQE